MLIRRPSSISPSEIAPHEVYLNRRSLMIGAAAAGVAAALPTRRLGGAAWARLHRWVYLAAGAAAVHYLLLVKSRTMEPVVYAAIVGLLLSYRVIRRLRGLRRIRLVSA
jgi:DMSO/TMAO reductase YedYZ heme-binding membrane subunit